MRRFMILIAFLYLGLISYGQVIADHRVVNTIDKIPQEYVDKVKKMWVSYAGESHSHALRVGMDMLEGLDSKFAVSVVESGVPEPFTASNLRVSRATWGDLNSEYGWIYDYGEEDWCAYGPYDYLLNTVAIGRTKNGLSYCNTNNLTISAFGFAWCYDDGYNLVHSYLEATKQYVEFCKLEGIETRVFFSTGPVDSYMANSSEGAYENSRRWKTIRDTVNNDPTRILFDYADILSYNDAGQQATQIWNGHSYAVIHPENTEGVYTGHIGSNGALKLAKAMWWMLARMAGWDGESTGIEPNDNGVESAKVFVQDREIVIEMDESAGYTSVTLINLEGKCVDEVVVRGGSCHIRTDRHRRGVYFVKLNKSDASETRKVIL